MAPALTCVRRLDKPCRKAHRNAMRPPRTPSGPKRPLSDRPNRAARRAADAAARPADPRARTRPSRPAKPDPDRPNRAARRAAEATDAPRRLTDSQGRNAPKTARKLPRNHPERAPEPPRTRPLRTPKTPENSPAPLEPQRIARLLARAGVASRRDIERMIAEGRIALNGEVITTPATIVSSLAGITVNGLTVTAIEPTRLFRFHKPAGVLTTARDPGGRPTIYDILPRELPRTVAVGRLDMNTEGLLLLTTDGGLKRTLELPATGVPRTYRVRAYGDIHQRTLENLIDGITVEGVHYGPIDATIERRTGRNLWILMTLTEGKNREIRRVLEHLGLQVSRLIRVSYGPIDLGDLPPRGVDEVPPQFVAQLLNMLKKPER